jgi:hypothetical protein
MDSLEDSTVEETENLEDKVEAVPQTFESVELRTMTV